MDELLSLVGATLTGMDVEAYRDEVAAWINEARDPRWKRPFTELVYQPQIELLEYLRANGYRTYIVTGGGQDFVRAYSEPVYGIPVEQVVGTMFGLGFEPGADGKPVIMREPKLLLNDDKAGKPEGIHLVIGRRPRFAFGNSPATSKCWNIRRRVRARDWRCWFSTTTACANTPTGQPRACPIRRSGHFRRDSTIWRTRTAGSSSA